MKMLLKLGNWVFYIIVSFTIIAAVSTAALQRPVLMTAVRSNSMYPLFQRGDMIFLSPFFSSNKVKTGDIIVFKTEGGSYDKQGLIVHRIIVGNSIDGFITKGDANDYTDQSSDNPPIKADWVFGHAVVIENKPIKIPLLGQLPLSMEQYSKSQYTLPIIAVVIGFFAIYGFSREGKKKANGENLNMPLIYFLGGITISILMFGTMFTISQHLKISYAVSESTSGSMSGSSIGILKVGNTIEKPLSELGNKGFIPTIAVITCDDNQISLSHQRLFLKHGKQVKTTMTVNALKPGKYNSTIHVGIFFPLLPENLIYTIAKKSYWLALVIDSIVPGLPLMFYPLIDSRLRRKTLRGFRRKFRRIKTKLSF